MEKQYPPGFQLIRSFPKDFKNAWFDRRPEGMSRGGTRPFIQVFRIQNYIVESKQWKPTVKHQPGQSCTSVERIKIMVYKKNWRNAQLVSRCKSSFFFFFNQTGRYVATILHYLLHITYYIHITYNTLYLGYYLVSLMNYNSSIYPFDPMKSHGHTCIQQLFYSTLSTPFSQVYFTLLPLNHFAFSTSLNFT